jgi:hypothetical protein
LLGPPIEVANEHENICAFGEPWSCCRKASILWEIRIVVFYPLGNSHRGLSDIAFWNLFFIMEEPPLSSRSISLERGR